jgi:hypothetical protein
MPLHAHALQAECVHTCCIPPFAILAQDLEQTFALPTLALAPQFAGLTGPRHMGKSLRGAGKPVAEGFSATASDAAHQS